MQFFKDEIGRVISQTTGENWTSASTKAVKVVRPSGTSFTKTGTDVVVDDAATGQIHILSATGDLSEVGEYLLQASFTTASTTLYCPLLTFSVEEIL